MNFPPVPDGVTGRPDLVRVNPRHTMENDTVCPDQRRAAVRPLLGPLDPVPFLTGPLQEFGTSPLQACLDLIEFEGRTLLDTIEHLRANKGALQRWWSPAHPAHLRWTEQALERYAAARAAEQSAARSTGLPSTEAVAGHWVFRTELSQAVDARGVRQYEHTIPGRRYESADGRLRDLWLTSMGRTRENRPDNEKAAIAHVMALGGVGPKPRFAKASSPRPSVADNPPERVRVFDFGCADGSYRQILDWDAAECRRRFGQHAAPAFVRAASSTGARPGGACVECKAISGCDALPRTPDLWGGRPTVPPRPRRSLSAWDLRLYGQCPAQYHLTRRLHVASLQPEGDGARRGRAVDAWLNEAHTRRHPRGCRNVPGPENPGDWSAGGHHVEGDLAQQGAAMLRQHQALCPLDRLGTDEQVLGQERVTAYVPELDVVVISVPDLLFTRAGGWVWRETKTEAKPLWEGTPLMTRYPQLALGVLLLASGAKGADPSRSRVELEVLHAFDATLEQLDPGLPPVVDEARAVIAELARPLLNDTEYAPRTGHHCLGCEARPWCVPGTAFAADHPDGTPRQEATHV